MARQYVDNPPRWPVASDDRRYDDDLDDEQLRVEVAPRVNPYSMVALAGSLIGLFPIAIVFGLISFGHPRGRLLALFAMLLGIAEAAAVAGLLLLSGFTTMPQITLHRQHSEALTSAATPPPAPPTSSAPPAPSAAAAPVSKGEACSDAQLGLIGAAADSSTMLCLRNGNTTKWSGPYTVSSTQADIGTKCVTGTDKTARTADGHALVCETNNKGAQWTTWVE